MTERRTQDPDPQRDPAAREVPANRLRCGLVAATYFAALMRVFGLGGQSTEALRAIEAVVAVCACFALLPEQRPRWRGLAAVALAAGSLLAPNDFGRMLVLVAGGTCLSFRRDAGIGRAAVVVLAAHVVLEVFPDARSSLDEVGASLAALLPGTPGDLLSLAAHGALPASAAVVFLAVMLLPSMPRAFSALLGCVAAAWTFQFPLAAWHARWIGPFWAHHHAPELFSNLPVLVLVLAGIVGVARSLVEPPEASPEPRRLVSATSTALLALGFVSAQALFGSPLLLSSPRRTAAFLNHGGIDWERPRPDEVGAWTGGMFGLLPAYMRAEGWSCKVVNANELVETLSSDIQLLVTINSPHKWGDDARAALRRHLARGGSLLALGDHTDIFGVQAGFNSVLEEYGMSFRFDAAYHAGSSWTGDMCWGFGLPQSSRQARDTVIAIGASIAVSGPAVPWIWGRYGFSDLGIRENVQGSFLGNYDFERSERLGDLVLAASTYSGRGQILAYGDTTGFQNSVLSASFVPHVAPTLDWLSRPALVSRRPLMLAGALALVAVALAALVPRARRRVTPESRFAFLAGLALGAAVTQTAMPCPSFDHLEEPLFVMDYAQMPNVGDYGVEANNPWPLAAAALRTGFVATDQDVWRSNLVAKAKCLAFVAPQQPLTPGQLSEVRSVMERGGCVLVAASGADAGPANELLEPYGMQIERSSRGRVPPAHMQSQGRPRLVDASRIVSSPSEDDVYVFGSADEPYVVARPVGGGWLVVAGDTRFFSTANVEGLWGYWAANCRLLMDILIRFAGGSPTAPEELLSPPITVDAFGNPKQ